MKRWVFFLGIATSLILSSSCKRETESKAPEKAMEATPPSIHAGEEIDLQKIASLTGIRCRILKTETLGYMPLHKFYWVCLPQRTASKKVEELALAIIKETIARKLKTYHSFTIHFFAENDLAGTVEQSKSFAHSTFLPEGSWLKVGKIPINDYKDYKLTCTFLD